MLKRLFLTAVLVLGAIASIGWKYQNYLENPWTRDGQVRAQVIQITPRVTGPIVSLQVNDNSMVSVGETLFEIDPRTYQVALDQAKASLAQSQVGLAKAQDEARRRQALHKRDPGSVSVSTLINLKKAVESAKAGVKVARTTVAQAALNLEFTQVKAPTDGFVTNLTLRNGSQVVANKPSIGLIDRNSFWIEAFFKETDIRDVGYGETAIVTLMAYPDQPLEGKVESIGYGIAHKDGSTGVELLPNVNPNFQWIRLAQRIPVRIKLDSVPDNIQLRVGTSASVMIIKHPHVEHQLNGEIDG
ncbi:HlyD family secretion protein [Photobacterium chitinilyticum]|uniref:HlyD family secretion protein n=1 Tax=Photobacterium chitinilyticum TaxID=2485123 RepID=A0A3S3UQA3_9GAMM|nr:HlyD family secretion protein [Photobacterium chitinilyticum]RWX57712.1 HlyD family secretion protein [Photobacterium chitinilyticum]